MLQNERSLPYSLQQVSYWIYPGMPVFYEGLILNEWVFARKDYAGIIYARRISERAYRNRYKLMLSAVL